MSNSDRFEIIPIQKNHNLRYAIYDNKIKFIIDDAKGWGFKSKESARKVLIWKYLNK